MLRYAAFLRGINVGGNKKVSMDLLKKTMSKAGYEDVKTLLASGNVMFTAGKGSADTITKDLEKLLEKTFGFPIPVLIRSMADLQKIADAQPFKGIKVTPETRLYVTFLSEKPTTKFTIPYSSDDGNFRITKILNGAVISILTVVPGSRTVDLMAVIEKEYGRKVTTRNWNTIEKILKAG